METAATRLFISYSRKDTEFAERLHAYLSHAGLLPYVDKREYRSK